MKSTPEVLKTRPTFSLLALVSCRACPWPPSAFRGSPHEFPRSVVTAIRTGDVLPL